MLTGTQSLVVLPSCSVPGNLPPGMSPPFSTSPRIPTPPADLAMHGAVGAAPGALELRGAFRKGQSWGAAVERSLRFVVLCPTKNRCQG